MKEVNEKSQVNVRNVLLLVVILLVGLVFVFAAPVLNYVNPSLVNNNYVNKINKNNKDG